MTEKAKQFQVVGPVAVLPTKDGSERYMYRGAIVGGGFTEAGIKHAVSIGLVAEFDVPVIGDEGSGKVPEPYEGVKVDDLKAAIAKRNEGREEADKVSAEGKRDDLVAALVADDEKQAAGSGS